ncbi:protoporphyrinogen oxidase [Adhaeribacter soli]|uniref:Coproporphyrinogen III oxidase n=1 Tax=Adhaeribacter soli TaxID=2607655 RepID=A0A5N1IHR4_9BACT|nr:protoporphyrinogen oxidase [Adhaeribacter soli]KAA9324928.1 protoporphyrinogen oxidase [Adhaeribacter soli]
MRVGIIGAGISGLVVAHQLQKAGIQHDLYEQADFPGGNIKSVRIKNYVLEMGPNSLLLTPEIEKLIRELKLEPEVVEANPVSGTRYIFRDGRYRRLPDSPLKLMADTYFHFKTKYRLLQERFLPPKPVNPHETISQFFERRFGREVLDYAVSPFVMGIFAGDPDQLLINKTFPKLVKYEQVYGSVQKGLLKDPPKRRKTISFKNGLQTLPLALGSKLLGLQTGYPVEMVTKSHGKYIISTTSPDYVPREYDVLVMAIPAHKATPLLEYTFPGLAAALRNVNYPPVAVVHTVYKKASVGFSLKGFGALHPKKENLFSAGVIWNSSIFPNRCPDDEVLFTTFVGGTPFAENTRRPRMEILKGVHEELKRNYQISAERPVYQHFYLWHQAIPQYDLYIEDAQQFAKTLETDNVFIAANWCSGVSIQHCVKRGLKVAKKIQELASAQTA